jgi:hypothetical protein
MRTDKHRPSEINPDDYDYVAMEHVKIEMLGDCALALAHREMFRKHQERTGGTWSSHEHGGNCMVCGNVNAVYTVIFYHEADNTYLRLGTNCAHKMDMGDPVLFKTFRTACKEALKNKKGEAKAESLMIELGLVEAWNLYAAEPNPDIDPGIQTAYYAIRNIVGSVVKYGDFASDKQHKYLENQVARWLDWPRIKAEREEERKNAEPCPTGRIVIEGVVLKTEEKFYDFGASRMVMTVKDTRGFVVWGTMPSSIDCMRGDTVRFTGTLEPSDRDEFFGFYKRPSKAEIISEKQFASAGK